MAYRVLRLMEYVFDDVEQADENMKHWAVPANGAKEFRTGNPVRSMIIQYPFKSWDDTKVQVKVAPPVIDTGLLREYGRD